VSGSSSTRARPSWSTPAKGGLKTLLVSGGFTFSPVIAFGMSWAWTHAFQCAGRGRRLLTGEMVDQPWGDICDGDERKMVLETCCWASLPGEVTPWRRCE
jgi:hypothetical protein